MQPLASFLAIVAAALLPMGAAHAASNYSEDFTDSQAQGWSSTEDWTVANGQYGTTANGSRTLSVYGGATWTTGYSYSARLRSSGDGTGTRVGMVFNYIDADNYYEILVDPAGDTTLARRNAGSLQTLGVGRARITNADDWMSAQVTLVGTTATVRINNLVVLNQVALPAALPRGRIGVVAAFTMGQFDDVAVSAATAPPAPNYLFRSGFGPAVTLNAPNKPFPNSELNYWYQNILGRDTATGFSWPLTMWGTERLQHFASFVPGRLPYEQYIRIELKNVTGPTGVTSRVLSNQLLQHHDMGGAIARSRLFYSFAGTPSSSFYIRRFLRYPADMLSNMGKGDFFVQQEYKTRDCTGPHGRLILTYIMDVTGGFYELRFDRDNNCGVPRPWTRIVNAIRFQKRPSEAIPLPVGEWFYDEYYVRYSATGTAQDLVQYAINGHVIFDHRGPVASRLPDRVTFKPGYAATAGWEILMDDLEVLEAPPCGTFPCGPPIHIP